jgi:hypothetical protein
MKWADTQGDTHRDTQEIHVPQKMFRLTDEQICKLKKVSELRGCSQTDLIRGFIDSLDEEPPDTQGDTHRDTQEIHGVERSSGADSPALAALVEQLAVKDAQLAKKDEQIAKLMDTVADSTKAVQGAQALHHETAQTLALESTEQKLSRWQRLKRAWRG